VILEEITTTFCDGKQVAEIVFDVAANNRLRIIGVTTEKEVSLTVIAKARSYLYSRERRLEPAYDFDPIFVNRNSQVAVCVTPAASSLPAQAHTVSCR